MQLFRRPHRQRKVFSSTPTAAADSSAATSITIVDSMRVFYKNLIQLMPSKDPIKGDIQLKITKLKLHLSLMDFFSPPPSPPPPSLSLSLSLSPEIRGEVSQMVSITDKIPIAVEKNKLLLPPHYNRYFMWGFPDYSARIATVEGDKVSSHNYRYQTLYNTHKKVKIITALYLKEI